MSRREQLMAKNANIRAASEITEAELDAAARNHKPRSGQASFQQRSRLEERIQELESLLAEGRAASMSVDLAKIVPNPFQPRRIFDAEELAQLKDSIATIGLIQPIVVRHVSSRDIYEIVAGERRLRAFKLLERPNIPALEVVATDAEMAAMALAENVSRADLTAYEIALTLKATLSQFDDKREQQAMAVGLNRTSIYKYYAYFKLPTFILNDLDQQPNLLGRDAADALASILKEHGAAALGKLRPHWEAVKARTLDQTKLAETLKHAVTKPGVVRVEREIKKLFVGKQQAGSITRDSAALTIRLKSALMNATLEKELRQSVESILSKHHMLSAMD